jgi:two-component system OmpR family sensor kinase
MIVRVFAFIWCANLLTLVLFSILVTVIDPTLPDNVMRRAELKLLEQQLGVIYTRDGPTGAQTFWQQLAPAHSSHALETNTLCGAPNAIGTADEGCFRLLYTGPADTALAIFRPAMTPLLIGALASAIMAIFLSRWLTRPLRDVSRGLKAIAAGHLDIRMLGNLRTSNREVQDLGRDFDFAAERLQALSEGRTRLYHDISHEIRSPLARLRAAVGLIEVTPARGATLVGRMEGDIARLDHLVDEILTLARFERGDQVSTFHKIDLLDLIGNIIADANFEGRVRGVTVHYVGSDTLELQGNPELLYRACENVIRNALAHSPDGGTVTVSGRMRGETIGLEVTDEGPGVPETALKNIFDPFVRVDKDTPSSGIGLGLAIAFSAVHAHGGSLKACNRLPHGMLLQIDLPTT